LVSHIERRTETEDDGEQGPRKILGPKKEEVVTGRWRKFCNVEHDLY
jgi:hypothetical protein